MSETPNFELAKIEIFNGRREDSPDVMRWYINHHYSDGSESIVDDKLTYEEALASAVSGAMENRLFNVPIEDSCTV